MSLDTCNLVGSSRQNWHPINVDLASCGSNTRDFVRGPQISLLGWLTSTEAGPAEAPTISHLEAGSPLFVHQASAPRYWLAQLSNKGPRHKWFPYICIAYGWSNTFLVVLKVFLVLSKNVWDFRGHFQTWQLTWEWQLVPRSPETPLWSLSPGVQLVECDIAADGAVVRFCSKAKSRSCRPHFW